MALKDLRMWRREGLEVAVVEQGKEMSVETATRSWAEMKLWVVWARKPSSSPVVSFLGRLP